MGEEYIKRSSAIADITKEIESSASSHRLSDPLYIAQGLRIALDCIKEQPAEAVEHVIRCQNCRWGRQNAESYYCHHPNKVMIEDVSPSHYCGYAEYEETLNYASECFKNCVSNSVLHDVIHKKGEAYQLNIAIEELSELIKELCKFKRGIGSLGNVSEEMADVLIMLEQCSIIFGNSEIVEKWKQLKLDRLRTNIKEGKV